MEFESINSVVMKICICKFIFFVLICEFFRLCIKCYFEFLWVLGEIWLVGIFLLIFFNLFEWR